MTNGWGLQQRPTSPDIYVRLDLTSKTHALLNSIKLNKQPKILTTIKSFLSIKVCFAMIIHWAQYSYNAGSK